ncbi:MAG: sulfatase-like hydrolase/transferase [Marinilabiliaceae bacterium]|nr:sulfatase-like hydrolase/transferase [Marinilabiliaceae bacterium]
MNKRRSLFVNIVYLITIFLTLVFKNIAFHFFCYDEMMLGENASAFWSRKLLAPLLLTSIVLLIRRRWFVWLMLLMVDIWVFSNLTYHRFYADFFDRSAVMYLSNLKGFESSVADIVDIWWLLLPASSLLVVLVSLFVRGCLSKRLWLRVLVLYYLMTACTIYIDIKSCPQSEKEKLEEAGMTYMHVLNPIADIKINAARFPDDPWYCGVQSKRKYVERYSVMSRFLQFLIEDKASVKAQSELPPEIEKGKLMKYIFRDKPNATSLKAKNIIIFLVESFESWLIETPDICPNLYAIAHSDKIFFADKMKSQIRDGMSSDGQLTMNTGLLPIFSGFTVTEYPFNVYPNIAHYYPCRWIITSEDEVWNQRKMTKRYGYEGQAPVEITDKVWDDKDVVRTLLKTMDRMCDNFCIQTLTISTHAPFNIVENDFCNVHSSEYKSVIDYINVFNYTDSCMGVFWSEFVKSKYFENTVVVITGDHTILDRIDYHEQFSRYRTEQGKSSENYLPFMIYSPDFSATEYYDSLCYQMDMFPTILSVIGHNDYRYKGVGVDLRDAEERQNRVISQEQAYELSERLIRADYFSKTGIE